MPRPPKEGLTYFTVDTDIMDNRKTKRIIRACGLESIAVIMKLLSWAYKKTGYYLEVDENLTFDISDDLNCEETFVNEVIEAGVQAGFFDKGMYEKYKILTSEHMQKYFKFVTKGWINSDIEEAYNLLFSDKTPVSNGETPVSGEETPETNGETPENEGEMPRKERKGIERKGIGKEGKGNARARAKPPNNLYDAEFSRISKAWNECGHGLLNTSNINTLREFCEKGLSADVIIYALKEAKGKSRKNLMRYIEAILNDKLHRGILTKAKLEADIKRQKSKLPANEKNKKAIEEFVNG
jgi:DnaD/phage-associated family protein